MNMEEIIRGEREAREVWIERFENEQKATLTAK
jgi:hypothetical protein